MLKRILEENKWRIDIEGRFRHEENQYLNLIEDILKEGEMIEGRNGYVKMICGSSMHFDLNKNKIPILTTKKTAWKTCLKELLWFISGSTDNSKLKDQNVKIWNGNASKEFLENQGLKYNEDDLGPIYGHQWRHFNAPYIDCKKNYKESGVDQLSKIINMLKDPKERKSRRIILSAWNPCQLEEMALPPCHVLVQFIVTNENKLSAILYQRSGDVGLGVPFNIASYAFLTHLLAMHCDLEALELIYHLGHCHIYDNHLDEIKKHLERIPYEFPTIEITKKNEIENYLIEDFKINNYISHESILMKMRQ